MKNYGSLLNPIIQSLQKDNIKEENNLYIWKNGDYYLGPLLNGLPNGKGKKVFLTMEFFLKVILSTVKLKDMGNILMKMVNIILDKF